MFKLHIYNPEHDIVLGKNDVSFTPPKAAQITCERFWHIPSRWADEGDWVLKPNTYFLDSVNLLLNDEMQKSLNGVRVVTMEELSHIKADEMPCEIVPWGWDKHLVNRLIRCNPLFATLVPTEEQLEEIRRMSSREFAAEYILPLLVSSDDNFTGEAKAFRGKVSELEEIIKNNGSIVLKSPWSCSGRGVRFVNGELNESERGWIKNVLDEQSAIMIEPIYNKVLDFAMEFHASDEGVKFITINIFETKEGKYIGNMNGSQEDMFRLLMQYIPENLIIKLREKIIEVTTIAFKNITFDERLTSLPFGIDMMIITDADNKTKVHPCVEMNLRRTMGQIDLT